MIYVPRCGAVRRAAPGGHRNVFCARVTIALQIGVLSLHRGYRSVNFSLGTLEVVGVDGLDLENG